ncbi:hypothetical protein HPB47_027571, partial [Ixodes persulcatus]
SPILVEQKNSRCILHTLCLQALWLSSPVTGSNSNHSDVDAWKTVIQNETFYLIYRSYEYDAGVGGTGKCVSLILCDKNTATRTARTRVMYRDAQTTELKGFTVRSTMARSWNSTVDDIVRHGDADNCSA